MPHVHGEKSVASAGTAKMIGGTSLMMKEGMGSMMKMGEEMTQVTKHTKTPGVATGVAVGAIASAGSGGGKTVISKIFRHPLVLFSLGIAVGYCVCKYRKSIISSSDEV